MGGQRSSVRWVAFFLWWWSWPSKATIQGQRDSSLRRLWDCKFAENQGAPPELLQNQTGGVLPCHERLVMGRSGVKGRLASSDFWRSAFDGSGHSRTQPGDLHGERAESPAAGWPWSAPRHSFLCARWISRWRICWKVCRTMARWVGQEEQCGFCRCDAGAIHRHQFGHAKGEAWSSILSRDATDPWQESNLPCEVVQHQKDLAGWSARQKTQDAGRWCCTTTSKWQHRVQHDRNQIWDPGGFGYQCLCSEGRLGYRSTQWLREKPACGIEWWRGADVWSCRLLVEGNERTERLQTNQSLSGAGWDEQRVMFVDHRHWAFVLLPEAAFVCSQADVLETIEQVGGCWVQRCLDAQEHLRAGADLCRRQSCGVQADTKGAPRSCLQLLWSEWGTQIEDQRTWWGEKAFESKQKRICQIAITDPQNGWWSYVSRGWGRWLFRCWWGTRLR